MYNIILYKNIKCFTFFCIYKMAFFCKHHLHLKIFPYPEPRIFFFFFLACCIMHHFSKTIILVEMRLKLGFKVNIKLHLQPILLLQVCVFEITMIFNKNKTVHQKLHENCHFRCGAIWWWIRKALWKNTPNDQKRVLKKANRFYCDFMLTLEQMSVILITYKQ